MATDEEDAFTEKVGGLDGRVLTTLQGLSGRIAFSGLRRALGAHPESLSRSLRRLQRDGRVDRSREGYRAVAPSARRSPAEARGLRPIAQVELPLGAHADALRARLSGRWFGSLRWVGVVGSSSNPMLAWARKDGTGYTLLGIDGGTLRVYVRNDDWAEDDGDAEDSAYQLLTHALDAVRITFGPVEPGVSFFAASSDDTMPDLNN